jgi:hypothetical protein
MLTDRFTASLAWLLGPVLRPVSRWLLSPQRKRPTWHFEGMFAALLLCLVATLTTPQPWVGIGTWRAFGITWVSAAAVFLSFLHGKVGYRMSEAMATTGASSVHCYEWSGRYWLGKELLWFVVFLLSGAYPAIVGNVIFMVYPAWREIHLQERLKLRGTRAAG